MTNRAQQVDRFMEELDHPLKEGAEHLRSAILEHIKWNAPSLRYAGEDRVTFRLYPEDRVELVFNRGAKSDSEDLVFENGADLLRWADDDRAVVALRDVDDAKAKRPALVGVVNRWVVAQVRDRSHSRDAPAKGSFEPRKG